MNKIFNPIIFMIFKAKSFENNELLKKKNSFDRIRTPVLHIHAYVAARFSTLSYRDYGHPILKGNI